MKFFHIKKRYHYYYVVNRALETAEVVMLADVIKASKLPVSQKKALVQRLSETLCSHQAENISKHIVSLDKGRKGNSSFIYNVDAIEHAINENKQISFLYFNYDEKHKKVYRKNGNRYTVSPAFMVWNKDNYYLLCFSNGHDNVVTYRLDKMEKVAVEETDREPHPEYELFNTEEYRKQVFSMFGGESQNVTLLFTANILSDMFDRFGDDIRIKKVDDDTYSVDITVQISKTFFAWIVGTQGRDVISQFVTTIIPRTETCFEWYLNFDLIDKPNEEKKMVWEFPIEFQEAKSYRTEVNSLLRPTQWQDLLVRVYV